MAEQDPALVPNAGGQIMPGVTLDGSDPHLTADARLQAIEERLRLAQEAAGIGIWEYQPQTGARWFSPGYLRLYGVSLARAEAFNMDQWLAALHPEDRERKRAARSAMLSTGCLDEEFRILRLDTGELRWLHSKAARFERPSGPLLIGINHDITARKLAIEAARERDQRLRMAFAATGIFAWDWDVTTGRVEWSEQGEAALRLPPGGFGGTIEAFRDLVHPDDRPDVEAALARALTGADSEYIVEFRMRRGDGTWRRTATRGIVQRDATGRPVRVFGVDYDISARTEAEEALAARPSREAVWEADDVEQRYRAALRAAAIVVFEQDLDLRYTWIDNPARGYQAQEVIGRTDFDLLEDAADAARLTALKRRVIATGIGLREQVSVRHQGARCHYDLSVDPLRDAVGAIIGVVCAAIDVTERRRNEAALEESQARFERAAEAARLAAYEVGPDKVARVTRAFWDLYGLPPDTHFDFSTLLSLVHPEDRPRVIADHEHLARTGGNFRAEFRIVRPDGSIGWLETRGEAQTGAADFPDQMQGVILDITDRKVAEAALREREERLRGVLDGMAEGFGLLAPDFTILEHNLEALRLDGRTRDEIVGRSQWEVYPGSENSELGRVLKRAMAERQPALLEYRYVWQDGHARWLEMRAYPTVDGLLSVFWRDVTDRKEAEERLRDHEERLRLATDMAEIGFWDVDPINDVLIWPPIVRAMFGISHDLPVSMTNDFYACLHPDDRDLVTAAYVAACDAGYRALYDVEYRTIGKEDGIVRWVAAKGRGIFDDQGRCVRVIGTAIDITARKAIEQALAESEAALRRLNEELEERVRSEVAGREEAQRHLAHAQRMEALGQLAGGIAHDFNNVLQAVEGGASLIEKRPGDVDQVRRFARLMIDAARRGSSITRRLLAFSRRGDVRAEVFHPVTLLENVREVLTHTLGSGIGVRVEATPDAPLVLADKGQLETVLINLATNARDAMAGQGVLTLTLDVQRQPDRQGGNPPSRKLPSGEYVHITVADTGCGMPPELLARVTEPFFTTKPKGQGTGLGLAMASGFIEQSNGAIAIESEVGRGSVVHLWLPATAAEQQENPEVLASIETEEEVRHILVVDDEAIVREVIAEQARRVGYKVTAVESASGALSLLQSGEPIDLLISDLSMPEMNGVALLREVNRLWPRIPAILLTGFATNAVETAVGGAVSGMFSLLRKPVTEDDLVVCIKVLLEGTSTPVRGG